MSIKNWILSKMSGASRAGVPRSPVLAGGNADAPSVVRHDARRSAAHSSRAAPSPQHLGPYAPLIGAIRDELEQFVASYVSLHLAIAEHDRYLLTSIDVRATAPQDDELLRRFMREFKPEQIKRYLVKEVIASLPNASALDLSQFAGLNAGVDDDAEEDDEYSELLSELRGAEQSPGARPYEVSLIGRWAEIGVGGAATSHPRGDLPRTPPAGPGVEIRIEDADGGRHARLPSAIPGRRYVIGKEPGCDIVVKGLYASRRHCEIWLERGSWWVTDAGSTNGIRVERGANVLGRSGPDTGTGGSNVVEIAAGARIVLSAHVEGSVAEYPRLTLETTRDTAAAATPIAPIPSLRATPSTPIMPARGHDREFTISAQMASGARTIELRADALPVSIGRSRSQTLVVDWAHEGVSGHHIDIGAIDDSGVDVVVHGDNGVTIAGTLHPQGSTLRWKPGESMILGKTIGREPECRLTLTRHG
jgi:pSer/pThr/pTyr-binding forkhead associated (FHA) protein